MKASYPLNKKAVSVMVSYVLLISITLSLSVIVYTWLRQSAEDTKIAECPDGVNLVISNWSCKESYPYLKVSIKNKGRFTTAGFVLRTSNDNDSNFGIDLLKDSNDKIKPGEEKKYSFRINDPNIVLIDLQPYYITDSKKVLCNTYVTQKISCS